MKIEFTKMHGLGNDFIVVNAIKESFLSRLGSDELSRLSAHLCNRRFAIGADQLLLLCPSQSADFRMRIFNADGSEVEMCGNGIRCLARYIWDRGLSEKDVLEIETLAGIIRPEVSDGLVRVDMGMPEFSPEKIPVDVRETDRAVLPESSVFIKYPLEVEGQVFDITCLSMGNPHCVIVIDDVGNFPVNYYGPMIENRQIFPRKINVEFVEILNDKEIEMRVWERGAGETMACGTGASAAAVATSLIGSTGREVTVHLLGGDLFIEWAENGHIYMAGPAVTVFDGVIDIEVGG
ncbi:Diaminopimelate epimerase [hydrothermal vent metagenome]|uniref:diaminopimelate epimerase n=1 Tax=hydrothermal vent metagenome TaxID=652676 RepID=A0A3B1CL35_9ZZZZ